MKKRIISLILVTFFVSCYGSYYYGSHESKQIINTQVIGSTQIAGYGNDINELVSMFMLNSLSNNIRLSEKNDKILTDYYNKNKDNVKLDDMDYQVNLTIAQYMKYKNDNQEIDKALCIEACKATLNNKVIIKRI